jgi:hypothetical protein
MLFINQITGESGIVMWAVESRFDNSRGDPFYFFLKAIGTKQDSIELDHAFGNLVAVVAASAHLAVSAITARYL